MGLVTSAHHNKMLVTLVVSCDLPFYVALATSLETYIMMDVHIFLLLARIKILRAHWRRQRIWGRSCESDAHLSHRRLGVTLQMP